LVNINIVKVDSVYTAAKEGDGERKRLTEEEVAKEECEEDGGSGRGRERERKKLVERGRAMGRITVAKKRGEEERSSVRRGERE
jgi:hypothetical protein